MVQEYKMILRQKSTMVLLWTLDCHLNMRGILIIMILPSDKITLLNNTATLRETIALHDYIFIHHSVFIIAYSKQRSSSKLVVVVLWYMPKLLPYLPINERKNELINKV